MSSRRVLRNFFFQYQYPAPPRNYNFYNKIMGNDLTTFSILEILKAKRAGVAVELNHRIINDRMEKSVKGRRFMHNVL